MALLPIFKTDDKDLILLQNKWSSILNPIISNPATSSLILKNVQLSSGTNVINHKLGRKLQGWNIVRLRGAASIYDDQDSNSMQDLTLVLVSNTQVLVDIEVF